MKTRFFLNLLFFMLPFTVIAASRSYCLNCPTIFGIRLEFIFFALVLIGIALFHKKALHFAIGGLIVVTTYKLIFDPTFNLSHHFFGENNFFQQIIDKHNREGEWSILLNLLGLLIGFAILANYFEESKVPLLLPKILPDDWKGPFVLLFCVYILSTFLDNIAAAIIGGTIALSVFNQRVHIGYLAAIVASSNAGGAGSVIGDTTTTMMWIDGVSAINVLHAFVGSFSAFLIFAIPLSILQNKYQKVKKEAPLNLVIDYKKLYAVTLVIAGAIISNILFDFPALGVWVAILISTLFTDTYWKVVKKSLYGTFFLLCLVTTASMMPVNELPEPSWQSSFLLGAISSVFDNIPLTKLALDQGCYDWGLLAFAVGFGGSMTWFGSSAGVAITNLYNEARSVAKWVANGWLIIVAYIGGFFIQYLTIGWQIADTREIKVKDCKCEIASYNNVRHSENSIYNIKSNINTINKKPNK
ncbi:MAG: hypothetical protein N3A01_00435 [Bacteroidales bacterium]|nr:hypothetical protein [Bacteroidales bacterium]